MNAAPFTWQMLLRRGWLLVLGVVLGTGIGAAVSRVGVSAEGAFHVNGVGLHQTPYQASRLARTYAQLLPQDPRVLARIADDTGVSRRTVRNRLSMSAQPATAVLFARYSADSSSAALAGLEALRQALHSRHRVAGASLRATIAPLSDPTTDNGFSRARALLLGALAGGLLALVLALALERREPRVDDLRDLARLVPLPVSRVRSGALSSVLDPLARRAAPGSVELVTVAGRRRARALAGRLRDAAPPELAAHAPRSARALVIGAGASAVAVQEAWRASLAEGLPVLAVLLVDRDTPLIGSRGRHGIRTA